MVLTVYHIESIKLAEIFVNICLCELTLSRISSYVPVSMSFMSNPIDRVQLITTARLHVPFVLTKQPAPRHNSRVDNRGIT